MSNNFNQYQYPHKGVLIFSRWSGKKILLFASLLVLILFFIVSFIIYSSLFSAPQSQAELEQFTVPMPVDRNGAALIDFTLSNDLKNSGFIKSVKGFDFAFGKNEIQPGAYEISKSMTVWQIAGILKKEPYMKWVVIPEGLRKEQIAEILAGQLGWNQQVKTDWITKYTAMKYDYVEGVYFPDTYLIPINEAPLQVAQRLINKFNEKFEPYTLKFQQANIKWTTALKLASIVQREAAGKEDMPLVAGILWNRLLKDMKLETDDTIQYIRDDVVHYGKARFDTQPTNYTSEGDWWKPVRPEDKDIASPYNTYRNKGLPPHPISNPGIDAIEAVLNPTETKCLFYLHDSSGQIHCSEIYEEHQKNIETYLKS